MPSATIQKVLSPARRVPNIRSTANHTSVVDKPVRPFYEWLHRPSLPRIRLRTTEVAPKQTKSPAEKLVTTLPGTISSAGPPTLRSFAMLARGRVDYRQDDFRKTQIPKPTTTAVKKAYLRRRSNILRMMGI
jgi:hypothetical protein